VREGLSVGLGRVAICTSADPWFDRSRHGGAVLEGCDVCTKIYESESVSVSTGSSVSSMISSLRGYGKVSERRMLGRRG
jgi:hypothetical protein